MWFTASVGEPRIVIDCLRPCQRSEGVNNVFQDGGLPKNEVLSWYSCSNEEGLDLTYYLNRTSNQAAEHRLLVSLEPYRLRCAHRQLD